MFAFFYRKFHSSWKKVITVFDIDRGISHALKDALHIHSERKAWSDQNFSTSRYNKNLFVRKNIHFAY